MGRSCSTPNARGGATPPSISRFASTTCCSNFSCSRNTTRNSARLSVRSWLPISSTPRRNPPPRCSTAPQHHEELSTAFAALLVTNQQHAAWEPPAALLDRTATLLPALLLARVDGRSPVEYLDDTQRATVRDFALPRVAASLTVHRETDPMDILAAWKDHLS